MPTELPADDISAVTTHESSDGWEIEDAGKLRATAEELHKDFEDVSQAPEDPSEAHKPQVGVERPKADDEPEPEKVAAAGDEPEAPVGKKSRSPATRTKELREEIEKKILTAKKHAEARELEDIERRKAAAAAAREERREPERPVALEKSGVPARPTWKAFDEAGKSWDDYVEAVDAYQEAKQAAMRAEDRAAIEREFHLRQRDVDARIEAERANAAHRARIEHAKTTHADFDQVIVANLSTIPNIPFLNDAVRNHPNGGELLYQLAKHPDEAAVLASLDFTNAMMDAVMASTDPAPLLLHLATNPEEHDRLLRMSPRQALIALGALQSRLSTPVREHGSRPGSKVSSAAPPIRPVGGAGVTADPVDDDDLDFGPEYIQRQNQRDFKRGIRP